MTKDKGLLALVQRIPGVKAVEAWRDKRHIKDETEILQLQNTYGETFIEHKKVGDRLENIEVELKHERLERENALAAAERTAQTRELEDELAQLELEHKIAELKRRKAAVEGAERTSKPPPQTKDERIALLKTEQDAALARLAQAGFTPESREWRKVVNDYEDRVSKLFR